jgi:Transposase DDE domain.
MRIYKKKLFIDLGFFSLQCHTPALNCEEMANEFWKDNIFSDNGVSACIRIPSVRRKISGQLQSKKFFLLGSVFEYDLCPTHLQREFERYTNMSACGKTEDLSHGHSGKDFPQYTGSSMPTLRRYSSSKPGSLMPATPSVWNWIQTIYALDATTIDLCLSLFPWATFRKRKGAVKLHSLLDLRGDIPTIAFITNGKVHEVNVLDKIPIEAGAIYIMDRGYLDYARLYNLHQSAAYFVTRAKSNFSFRRLYSQMVNKSTELQCDQIVTFHGYYSKKDYPERLRRIAYYDATQKKKLVFLTNNFTLPALAATELYRKCRQIELFFKWIKQHLR